jgi:predicted phage terminase large subunit-like protein
MLAAYSDNFAADWGRKARNILEEFGQEYFGQAIDPRTSAANRWNLLNRHGGMITAGVESQFTGMGAHLLILDDPIKNGEEALSENRRDAMWDWWQSTAFTRLEPDGVCVVIMTRWHTDDLVGRLIQQGQEANDRWTVINLPALAGEDDLLGRSPGEALWPERWNQPWLETKRAGMNKYWWECLYQQNPTRSDKVEWGADYFPDSMWIKQDEWPTKFDLKVMMIDPSKGSKDRKGDFSAIVFLGIKNGIGYVDSSIERRPVSEIVRDGLNIYERYKPHCLGIETNQFQELLVPEFNRQHRERSNFHLNIEEVDNRVNKVVRIQRLDPYLRNGELKFLDNPSNHILVNQLKEFPLGSHDDGPDALEGAVRLAIEMTDPMLDDGLGNNLLQRMA